MGGITENDVNLATASNAIIIGFNVRPEAKAAALASGVGVDIRLYNVIYDATDDVKKALEGLLTPTIQEKTIGHAEVRQIFMYRKTKIGGCMVVDGVARRDDLPGLLDRINGDRIGRQLAIVNGKRTRVPLTRGGVLPPAVRQAVSLV